MITIKLTAEEFARLHGLLTSVRDYFSGDPSIDEEDVDDLFWFHEKLGQAVKDEPPPASS